MRCGHLSLGNEGVLGLFCAHCFRLNWATLSLGRRSLVEYHTPLVRPIIPDKRGGDSLRGNVRLSQSKG